MNNCYKCGSTNVEVTAKEEYHYKECGLDDVYLIGIKKYKCNDCGEISIEFPLPKQLHRVIGELLCKKDDILSGKEVAFLRKEMRKSGKEFALMLSITAEHLSRVEHDKSSLSGSIDTLIRALYTIYICEGEIVSEGAFDTVSKKKEEHIIGRRIELTPSDWLMQKGLCCAVA